MERFLCWARSWALMINGSPFHDSMLKELESTVILDPSFLYPPVVTTPLWACALDLIDRNMK